MKTTRLTVLIICALLSTACAAALPSQPSTVKELTQKERNLKIADAEDEAAEATGYLIDALRSAGLREKLDADMKIAVACRNRAKTIRENPLEIIPVNIWQDRRNEIAGRRKYASIFAHNLTMMGGDLPSAYGILRDECIPAYDALIKLYDREIEMAEQK